MSGNTAHSVMGKQENEPLAIRLARSRVEPEYTMGALTERTGTRPETVRSWERRYGFPQPSRTPTNIRMYTERDIEAIHWLNEQTASGQSISAAIDMLRRRLDEAEEAPDTRPVASEHFQPPIDALTAALASNRLAGAQQEWDSLAIATSPVAMATRVLLPASQALDATNHRALAFLLRKATVLLDHAMPDDGDPAVGILAPNDTVAQVAATVLATSLARAGARVISPFADPSSMDALSRLRAAGPDHAVLLITGGTSADTSVLTTLLGIDAIETWDPVNDDPGDLVARTSRP